MTIVIDRILKATTRQELFGTGDDDSMRQTYRKLARQSHPDMFSSPHEKARAEKAFKHLTVLWEESAKNKVAGSSSVVTKKHSYDVGVKLYENDVFVAHHASYDAGHKECELLISRSPADNDLLQAAGSSLKKLNKDVPENYRAFFPEFVEMFKYRQQGVDRATVAQKMPEGFVSLKKVKEAYPHGINGRDVAWIFKRMLVAIGNSHDAGLVHGGISGDAFLIHPELHGVILSGWQYSVETGKPLVAIDASVKSFYPESVFSKEAQDYRLDIRMAAKLAQDLLEANAPRQLRIFLSGCMVSSVPHPADLLTEFDELLLRIYGAPKFHVFTMPKD